MNPWRVTPAVKVLLIANTAIYVVQLVVTNWIGSGLFADHLALTPARVFSWPIPEVWQVATYMWLHSSGDPTHLLFNLLMLWMLGGLLEQRWGSRSFVKFYVLCGIGAGICIALVGLLWRDQAPHATVGASGAIFGLTVAFGIVYADLTVYAMMIVPMRGRTLMLLLIGFQFLLLLARAPGISVVAHLSGAAIGYLLVTGYWRPSRLFAKYRSRRPPPKSPPRKKKVDYLKVVPREDDEDHGGNGAGKYLH